MENRITVETAVVLDRKIKRVVDYAHRRCHFPESLFPLIYANLFVGLGLLSLLPLFEYMEHILGMRRLPYLLSITGAGMGWWFTRRRQRGRYWEYEDSVSVSGHISTEGWRQLLPIFFAIVCTFPLIWEQWGLAACINLAIGMALLTVYPWKNWKAPFQKECVIINAEQRMTYVFTEEKILFGNQDRRALSYDLVRYMAETEACFVLFENEVLAHVIPKDQIVEGDEEQLRWLLQAQANSVVQYCDVELDFKKCKRLFFIATTVVLVLTTLFTVLF